VKVVATAAAGPLDNAAIESGDGTTTTGDDTLGDADGAGGRAEAPAVAVVADTIVPPNAPVGGRLFVVVIVEEGGETTIPPEPPAPILSPPPIPRVFSPKPPETTTYASFTPPPLPAKGRSANGSSDPVWNPPGCGCCSC
jgi:hypothetical protein